MQPGWNRILALCAALLAAAAAAEEPKQAPSVPLDRLLTLPGDVDVSEPRYGGATRSEWRTRFEEVRNRRDGAQKGLNAAQEELQKLAADGSQWQVAAPGIGGVEAATSETGPLSYRLRQEIKRQREELERAERDLQELRIEANLAGVPQSWTQPEPEAP